MKNDGAMFKSDVMGSSYIVLITALVDEGVRMHMKLTTISPLEGRQLAALLNEAVSEVEVFRTEHVNEHLVKFTPV